MLFKSKLRIKIVLKKILKFGGFIIIYYILMSILFAYVIPKYESWLVKDQPEDFYISATLSRKYDFATSKDSVWSGEVKTFNFVLYWIGVSELDNNTLRFCGNTNYEKDKKVTHYYFRNTWYYIPHQFYTYECKT